jgi:hypothetical protein
MNDKFIHQIDDSTWSTDYDRLVELMKQHSIVCTVEYRFSGEESCTRDVAKTTYKERRLQEGDDGTFEISVRGYGYVIDWTEADFKAICAKHRVRFLDLERMTH